MSGGTLPGTAVAPGPGGAGGAGGTDGAGGLDGARGEGSGRWRQLLLVVVVALLALALAVAANRAWHTYQAYRRLDAARSAPGVRDPAQAPVQDWLPVRVVARNHRVPVDVLLNALRDAGFTVQPQDTVPDLPGPFRRAVPSAVPGSPGGSPGARTLPPDRQSLRQIALYSHRHPSDAVRVVDDTIRAYRQERGLPPEPSPGSGGVPGSGPGGPPRDGLGGPGGDSGGGLRDGSRNGPPDGSARVAG